MTAPTRSLIGWFLIGIVMVFCTSPARAQEDVVAAARKEANLTLYLSPTEAT